MAGSSGQVLPREVLAPKLSYFSPQWIRQRCDTHSPPQVGATSQPTTSWVGPGPVMFGLLFWVLAGLGVGGEQHPCSVGFVILFTFYFVDVKVMSILPKKEDTVPACS